MKKTLIAMFALTGVAMADTVDRTDYLVLPESGTATYVSDGGFAKIGDVVSIDNLLTNAATKDLGCYYGGNNNKYDNPGENGEGTLETEGVVGSVTLCGRSGVGGDSFAFVLAPNTGSIGLVCDMLTLQLSGDPANALEIGGTFGIGIADATGITASATGTLENVKTSGITTVTLTLDKAVELTDSTKIIAAFCGAGGTKTTPYTITGIIGTAHVFTAPVVPEPATATLSLLALAGLAARRRRH